MKLGNKITTLKTQDKLVNFGAIMIVKRLECVLDKDMKKRFVAILNSTMEKLNYKPSDYHIVERNNMIGAFYSPIDLDLDYSKNEPKSKPLYIADTSFCLSIGKHAFSDEILFGLEHKNANFLFGAQTPYNESTEYASVRAIIDNFVLFTETTLEHFYFGNGKPELLLKNNRILMETDDYLKSMLKKIMRSNLYTEMNEEIYFSQQEIKANFEKRIKVVEEILKKKTQHKKPPPVAFFFCIL
ncbi:MAG: hypothetical protein CL760_09240 [Chloroflexi bacterium]|nr:hypothetical protein [Chloroflexota bacterium]